MDKCFCCCVGLHLTAVIILKCTGNSKLSKIQGFSSFPPQGKKLTFFYLLPAPDPSTVQLLKKKCYPSTSLLTQSTNCSFFDWRYHTTFTFRLQQPRFGSFAETVCPCECYQVQIVMQFHICVMYQFYQHLHPRSLTVVRWCPGLASSWLTFW